jgi:hypothetical protein
VVKLRVEVASLAHEFQKNIIEENIISCNSV